jgi:hypothetical protein
LDEYDEEHDEDDEPSSCFSESFTFQLKNIRINKFILCVMQHHRFFNKKLNKEVICSCL